MNVDTQPVRVVDVPAVTRPIIVPHARSGRVEFWTGLTIASTFLSVSVGMLIAAVVLS